MRTRTLVAAAFLLSAALPAFARPAATPLSTEMGPPKVTAMGCESSQEWTVAYVRSVLDTSEAVMRRMNRRFSYSPMRICLGDPAEVGRLLVQAGEPRRFADKPDKAIEYRRLSLVDESGEIKPDGLGEALRQRAAVINTTKSAKAAGVTSASWTPLGPFTTGGRVRAIAVNPTNNQRILVGSVSGGLWKSTNGGTSFAVVNDFLASVAITCLVHDPVTPATMYACTGEGAFNVDAVRGLGIFKSTDSGDTWTQIASTNPGAAAGASNGNDPAAFYYVNRLAIHPTTPSIVLAATNRGIFRSTDAGANWTRVLGDIASCTGKVRVYDLRFDPANGNRVLAGEASYGNCVTTLGGAIQHSADAGVTWTRVPLAGNGRVEIAHAPSSVSGGMTQTWYASNYNAGGEIWRSTGGNFTSWTKMSGTQQHLGGQGWYDNTIWVSPENADKLLVGGVSLYLSINGGANLQPICGLHSDQHAIVQDPQYATNGIIWNGNDGGVYKLTGLLTAAPTGTGAINTCQNPNNGTGTQVTAANFNNGLAITQFYGGAGGSLPVRRLAGGTQDNGSLLYNYSNTTWNVAYGGDGSESAVDHTDSAYSYGATQYLGLHRNTAGAGSASPICSTITEADCTFGQNPNPQTNFISPILLDPNNANRLYAGASSLWRSDNVKAVTPTFTSVKAAAGTNYINMIAVAPGNPDIVWVGHNNGALFRTVNGTAGAPTWVQLTTPANRQVTRILIDKDDAARVWVSFGGYSSPNVYLTTNGLDANPAFTSKHANLPTAPIRALARHPSNNLWIYAGTEVGLFTTEDGGTTWSASNDGPGTVSVEELFFLDSTTLIASTHGRGMFQATVTPPANSPGTLQLSTNALVALETAGTVGFTVTRTGGSTGAVSVNWTTATTGVGAGHAAAGSDFTAASGTLNWAGGDVTPRAINVTLLTDQAVEGSETFNVVLSNPVGATLGTPTTATVTMADPDVFPVNCQIPAGWSTPGTANAGWAVATDQKFEGACSLKSLPVGNSQKAQIQFAGTFVAGNITFRRRVSSELGWDYFRFFIDGVEQGATCPVNGQTTACNGASATGATATGTTEWNQPSAILSFPITAGNHTITFSYEKDTSDSAGSDAAWIDSVTLPLPQTGAKRFDFNSDGKPDVIYRHAPSGATYVWRMNGLVLASDQLVTSIDPTWSLIGHGDFDGDGKNDMVWRNNTTGTAYVWYMNDGVFLSDAFLFTIDPVWKIEAVADFNNNGKPDFLFRHSTSGLGFVWYFNNTTPVSDSFLYSIDNVWIVENVGDFNNDGFPDFFFRNTASGLGFVWLWNGTALGGSYFLFGIDPVWQVVQIVDWNNDGNVDMVFRNDNTGVTFVWYTNGTALQGSDFLFQIDGAWKIVPYR